MNMFKTYATRMAMAAVVAALGAGFSAGAMAQGTVTLSNTTGNTCQYSSMTVQPNGNIAVSCNSANPVPSCTISGPTQVNTGASASLTATCTNTPNSYTWAISPTPAGGFTSPNSATLTGTLPDGAYSFTVTAANGNGTGPTSAAYGVTFGTPSSPPTCTATATSPINVGDNSTLSSSCTGASTYAWTLTSQPAGASATASASTSTAQATGFSVAGTYTYQLVATNGAGNSTPATATIIVNAPTSGTCPTIGTAPPSNGSNIYNLRFDLKPGVIGSAAFDWPIASDPDKTKIRMFWIKGTSSETPVGTQTQITISPCPGQMTTSTPACTGGGWSGTSFTVGAGTACTLTPGQRYYVNVKQTTLSGGNCVPTGQLGINYCTSYVQGTPLN